ncbi:MAG: zinc-dependent peptidase [Vulcanimicrobiota bacterium]
MRIGPSNIPPSRVRSIVPGEYPQVQKDMETFPQPVLDLLDGYGVKVAVLDDDQTLVDSPALRYTTAQEYTAEIRRARQITQEQASQAQVSDLLEFAEKATRELRKAGLEFHFGVANRTPAPEEIAAQQKIPEAHLEDWKSKFQELNQGFPGQLFLLPHTYHNGKPIPENRLRTAHETSAEYVEKSLGINRAEDRLVLLHEKFTPANAVEVGNYRLVLHEVGHALDHALDRMVAVPGFGPLHRQTVDALYEQDLQKAESQGLQEVFTTDRASENVREYFAEAVEAYLTFPGDSQGEIFRTRNSNPELKRTNPELYTYLDKVMKTPFTAEAAPEPPGRPLLPDFVPDPDTRVYTF